MINKKATKVTQGKVLIYNGKGEVIDLGTADIKTVNESKNRNFFMIYKKGMQKTGILIFDLMNYLLLHMSNQNTICNLSNEKLAKELNVHRHTIERVKTKLKEANYIKYNNEIIFVNPDIYYKGNAKKQIECAVQYKDIK